MVWTWSLFLYVERMMMMEGHERQAVALEPSLLPSSYSPCSVQPCTCFQQSVVKLKNQPLDLQYVAISSCTDANRELAASVFGNETVGFDLGTLK